MGYDEQSARKALVATKNAGIELAMDFCANNPKESPTNLMENSEESKKKKKKPRFIPLELQKLFTKMKLEDRLAISTEGIPSVWLSFREFYQNFM